MLLSTLGQFLRSAFVVAAAIALLPATQEVGVCAVLTSAVAAVTGVSLPQLDTVCFRSAGYRWSFHLIAVFEKEGQADRPTLSEFCG